jgi:GT2 family glycosyltransferase
MTLSWQGKDKLQKLKTSLVPALKNLDAIWHIKENGSKDGSIEEILNWKDIKVNLVKCSHNRDSYALGMNILFNEASPKPDDVIITLNNDVIIEDSNSLVNMIKLLIDDKDIGIVGAKLNYMNTSSIQHCGVLFHPHNGLPFHYRAGVEEADRDRLNRYYPVITGAVAALTADTFANCYTNKKSGNKGFMEDYIFAFEDVDMSLRINHFLKKKVLYCGQTHIFHEESASLKKNPVHKMFFQKNCKLFLDNWHKNIDRSLVNKYEDPYFGLYSKKDIK